MVVTSPLTEALVQLVIAAVVILVSHKIIQLYWTRRKLPPGPFPWPVIGNILSFRKNNFSHEVMDEIAAKYGPVFSLFLGHQPNVIILDAEIGLQCLKKHTFAGRPQMALLKWFFKEDSTDIVFADFGKEWEALRKVGHSAARKYAVSPQLSPIVTDAVDRVVTRVGNQACDSSETLSTLMILILAEAAFGKKYDSEDPEFIKWKEMVEMERRMDSFFMILMFMPFLRHVFRKKFNLLNSSVEYRWEYIGKMYQLAMDSYEEGKNETFCDAMITAKKEAEQAESWMKPYLKPQNILNAVSDLFGAGSETTTTTLRWLFLLMVQHPDLQQRMRKDVDEAIGDTEPNVDDKDKLPLICAFISESMRLKPILPSNIPHKTTVDEEVIGHKIPKGTTVLIYLNKALHDDKVWRDPHVFRPDRFLDADGKFISKPNSFFIPFSDGRRSCPGNKLAFNNMFLIVTRFLQRTTDIQVVGGVTDEHMRGDLSQTSGFEPIPYSLRLTPRI